MTGLENVFWWALLFGILGWEGVRYVNRRHRRASRWAAKERAIWNGPKPIRYISDRLDSKRYAAFRHGDEETAFAGTRLENWHADLPEGAVVEYESIAHVDGHCSVIASAFKAEDAEARQAVHRAVMS